MLAIADLRLAYRSVSSGEVQAVRGVSIDLAQGEFYTLLGPSGCGKSSTLRCVAGLETPDSGEIRIGGQLAFSSAGRVSVPAHKRNTGMVFQSYAIWPHMTILDNVALPLSKGRFKLSKRQARDRAMDALRLVQLDALAERPAPHLSGGQQQRVALARALALEPAVLLLDEPLSNLDAKLREDMRRELKSLAQRVNITSLYVTHDQMEALALSDRIAIMRDGVIVQEGRPWDIYTRPNSTYVAQFLGKANLIQGVASPGAEPGETAFACEAGSFRCAAADAPPEAATPALLACRPESIALHAAPPPNAENVVEGEVVDLIFLGDVTEHYVAVPGAQLTVRSQRPWPEGSRRVFVELPPDACLALPAPPDAAPMTGAPASPAA